MKSDISKKETNKRFSGFKETLQKFDFTRRSSENINQHIEDIQEINPKQAKLDEISEALEKIHAKQLNHQQATTQNQSTTDVNSATSQLESDIDEVFDDSTRIEKFDNLDEIQWHFIGRLS